METYPLTILIVAALFVVSRADSECTRRGLQCKDCFTLANCVEGEATGTFHYVDEIKCPIGIACDEFDLYCSRRGACRMRKFTCSPNQYDHEVLFPDPYSCNVYHGCFGDVQKDYRCPNNTAFDPYQETCSLSMDDKNCREYSVMCKSQGEDGTMWGKYYYQCVLLKGTPDIIYPEFRLADDRRFDRA